MTKPYTYFYNGQIKNYISQFMRIFSGIQVKSKAGDIRTCHMYYGDMERVVANVLFKEQTFQNERLPLMSAWLTQIDINQEARKSRLHVDNVVRTRENDGQKVVSSRLMSVPYKATMDLYMYTSSNDEMLQLQEQILLLFNPDLTIQTNDNLMDWSYLTRVELVSTANEENFPASTDARVLNTTFTFTFDIWLDFPAQEYSGIIEQIYLNIKDNTVDPAGIDLDTVIVDEFTPE